MRYGHTAPLAIQRLQLLDPDYGTVFPLHLKEAGLLYNRFRQSLKHFCLDNGAMAQCELFQLRHLQISLLTCLHISWTPMLRQTEAGRSSVL